jgi:hypothetical protein
MPSVESPGPRASVDQAAAVTPATGEPRSGRPFWREPLAPYATARLGRAMLELATAVVPYVALSVLMYLALSVSYLLVLAIAVPAAGFLLRTYMVFHDCAHGSFLPSRRANVWLGTALGLVVFSPFQSWRHNHAVHHATAGDLERRGVGDVLTLTVTEYHARLDEHRPERPEAEHHERVTEETVCEPSRPSPRRVFGNGERQHVADAAPVEVPGGRVMDRMVVPPTQERREHY